MRKYVALVAGILLGACFLFASVPVLFNIPMKFDPPPEGTPTAHLMAAFGPTGYFKFVKTFEFVGALLVMIPRVRNLGLLLLGPVIVNILAFHIFVDDPANMRDPMHIIMISIIVVCSLYLVWDARKKFSALVN
jgi:putative oxidoreductase